VLAGFFPTSVSFRGSFRYANTDDLETALAAIQELIDGEDDDLAPALELKRRDRELRVRVETTCARDHYLAYETLIEALASNAIDGDVTGEIDDTITTYSASKVVAQVAALVWIPLLACEELFEIAAGLAWDPAQIARRDRADGRRVGRRRDPRTCARPRTRRVDLGLDRIARAIDRHKVISVPRLWRLRRAAVSACCARRAITSSFTAFRAATT
jgi:hypothetical protein